jgi:hypothetical protein
VTSRAYKRFYAKLATIMAMHHPERRDAKYYVDRIVSMVHPPGYWDGPLAIYGQGNPEAKHDKTLIADIVRAVLGLNEEWGTA